jgi:Tfp pilus assembly protein PilX
MESLNRRIGKKAPDRRSRRQSGAVLIIALIVLALMSYAAASVIRSTDTGTLVSGNLAFRQATMHAADVAVDRAWEELVPENYATKAHYFSTRQTTTPNFSTALTIAEAGIWDTNSVPCIDERGMSVDCSSDTGGFRIQYLIERQCDVAPDLGDALSIKTQCDVDPATAARTAANELGIYFRVIIRARGPRGTLKFYEVMISGPAV